MRRFPPALRRPRRALAGWAPALLLFCVAAQASPAHRYEVSVDPSLERLAVRACFAGQAPPALVAQSDGARFYLESMRAGGRALVPEGDKVALGVTGAEACVDYVVNLQPAQTKAQTGGAETRRIGRTVLSSIGDWLWRPQDSQPELEVRFRLPAGVQVSAPWRRISADAEPVFLAGATPYDWAGIVAFGDFVLHEIAVPGAVLHVAVLDAAAERAWLEQWIEHAARNVALLYGRFPVDSLQVVVAPAPRGRGPVPWAYVARGGGPAVHLFVNTSRPAAEFERDWSLTHEMSHLFLPYVVSRDAWLFEGLPTYLQSVLMARGGTIDAEEGWRRMLAGFERGARTAPELSLARANERVGSGGVYLRVYWGGAAMMLAADLQLRAQTGGERSLDSALLQLARCCQSEPRRWRAQEIIARLDELTGTTVFGDVVKAQFAAPGFPDFQALLARAGVSAEGAHVRFDASAPWAPHREALMRAQP